MKNKTLELGKLKCLYDYDCHLIKDTYYSVSIVWCEHLEHLRYFIDLEQYDLSIYDFEFMKEHFENIVSARQLQINSILECK